MFSKYLKIQAIAFMSLRLEIQIYFYQTSDINLNLFIVNLVAL